MKKIIEELKSQIKKEIGIMPVLAPQKAGGNTAMITLFFTGMMAAGELPGDNPKTANEELDMTAVFSIAGTHENWLNTAISYSRRLMQLVESGGKMPLKITYTTSGEEKTIQIYAQWNRTGKGQFVYDEEDKNMPVTYAENYTVTIVYPAYIVGGIHESNG